MNRVAAPSKIAEGWRLHGGAAALAIRLALTAAALVVWFWSQSLIGGRVGAGNAIGDRLLDLTAPVNAYLISRPPAADGLLIASSGIIDLLGLFLLARWIFGVSTRPFIGLIIVLGLRQTAQALVTLPIPANAIWHYPGFPSLLVTYAVANDYFFSGHTAIAVLALIEIAGMRYAWLTVLAVLITIFEIASVLALRVHYTMDVFTGVVTGLYAAYLAASISTRFGTASRGKTPWLRQ